MKLLTRQNIDTHLIYLSSFFLVFVFLLSFSFTSLTGTPVPPNSKSFPSSELEFSNQLTQCFSIL